MRFDTKYDGRLLGEGGERYYNFVRLVRGGVGNATSDLGDGGGAVVDDDGSAIVDPGLIYHGLGDLGFEDPGTNGLGLLDNGCVGLTVGDACSLIGPLGVETGICRTGFAVLRCVPDEAFTFAPPPLGPGGR